MKFWEALSRFLTNDDDVVMEFDPVDLEVEDLMRDLENAEVRDWIDALVSDIREGRLEPADEDGVRLPPKHHLDSWDSLNESQKEYAFGYLLGYIFLEHV